MGEGTGWRRALYGSGLAALGACVGIVLGSWLETPRLLLERIVSPVETVWIDPDSPSAEDEAAGSQPPLERFAELTESGARGSRPAAEAGPEAPREPSTPSPKPPPVLPSSAKPAPVSPDALIAEIARRRSRESAEPTPTAPEPETPEADPPRGRVIQVASFTTRKDAQGLVARLRTQGFRSFVSRNEPDGSFRFRVRVAPRPGQALGSLADDLAARGYDTWKTTE